MNWLKKANSLIGSDDSVDTLSESKKYNSLVYIDNDEDMKEFLAILNGDGEQEACDFLTKFKGGEPQESELGGDDTTFTCGEYTVGYNKKLGYVSLNKRLDEYVLEEKNQVARAPRKVFIVDITITQKVRGKIDTVGQMSYTLSTQADATVIYKQLENGGIRVQAKKIGLRGIKLEKGMRVSLTLISGTRLPNGMMRGMKEIDESIEVVGEGKKDYKKLTESAESIDESVMLEGRDSKTLIQEVKDFLLDEVIDVLERLMSGKSLYRSDKKLVQQVISFLIDTEQYGDGWGEHIDVLQKLNESVMLEGRDSKTLIKEVKDFLLDEVINVLERLMSGKSLYRSDKKLVQQVISFLIDTEQYGDGWGEHIEVLQKLNESIMLEGVETLSQYRKELKKLGFKLKTSSNSLGRFAKYIHIDTGIENGIINAKSEDGKKALEGFKKLTGWMLSNTTDLKKIADEEGFNKVSFLLKEYINESKLEAEFEGVDFNEGSYAQTLIKEKDDEIDTVAEDFAIEVEHSAEPVYYLLKKIFKGKKDILAKIEEVSAKTGVNTKMKLEPYEKTAIAELMKALKGKDQAYISGIIKEIIEEINWHSMNRAMASMMTESIEIELIDEDDDAPSEPKEEKPSDEGEEDEVEALVKKVLEKCDGDAKKALGCLSDDEFVEELGIEDKEAIEVAVAILEAELGDDEGDDESPKEDEGIVDESNANLYESKRLNEMARKVTDQAVMAFLDGDKFKSGNTTVTKNGKYTELRLHNNVIARRSVDGMEISSAGWETNTTKERLNGLPEVSIQQKKGVWYLNGDVWTNPEEFVTV